jgi:hypothetical protein
MKTIKTNPWLVIFALFSCFFASIGVCQAEAQGSGSIKKPPVANLQVLASVGPLEYLSGAEVTVRD